MHRMLKPGGRGLIIDLRRNASPEIDQPRVQGMGLNAVNKILTKLTFRFMLIKTAYTEGNLSKCSHWRIFEASTSRKPTSATKF